MVVGKSVNRVDAFDKVTGRAKYTDDMANKSALVIKILHSQIAHGFVRSIDTSDAAKIDGVIYIATCFDVPQIQFPTAGHPWSTDPHHQDVADRLLLNKHVRYYGDDIAAVVARDEISATKALRAIKVEYDELPFVLDPIKSMQDDAPLIHEEFPNNILAHTSINDGNCDIVESDNSLIKVEGWYRTPIVQHCHIENHICIAEESNGKINVISSTQIPHIVRRVVGQALGVPWGTIRIIKPYIGGGFGNKQDALYEPLCAYLCSKVGGRAVKLDVSREETFICNRVRHSIQFHLTSWLNKDGSIVARKVECYSNQGAYASHGHGIVAKGGGAIRQLYPTPNFHCEMYTVYTNTPASGAMRGYGIPQAMFALESHTEDIALRLGMDPIEYRKKFMMPVGYYDPFSKNCNYFDSLNQCVEKGKKYIDWDKKRNEYTKQTGDIRKGVGMALFWYNTAVWPISLESCSCRMILNQDGSIQMQLGETEIGQGADTAFSQMAADAVSIPFEDVHIISTQDTDTTPFGTGAYASRQTYVAGFAIKQTADILREKILNYAHEMYRMPVAILDLVDGNIVRKTDHALLGSLKELATEALYSLSHSIHITAESTYQIRSNAYSLGCCFAEVEVDIPLCKAKLLNIINVHDCGNLINPALAEAQVHGGMSMGIGFGLSEQLLFDERTGKPLNNNLLDYKLSTIMDHPHLEAQFVENAEPTSVFGTKALGEPPATPCAPAIRNAILNATGVAVNQIPINPHVLFARFREEGLV